MKQRGPKRRIDRSIIAGLIDQGLSNAAISLQLKSETKYIARIRKELGYPKQPRAVQNRGESKTWPAASVELLRQLWNIDRLPASRIVEKFDGRYSRDSIISAVHRFKLSSRPSPIKRTGEKGPRRPAVAALHLATEIRRGPRPGAQNPTAIAARQASRAADADRTPRVGTKYASPFPHLQFGARQVRHAQPGANTIRETVPELQPAPVDSETSIERPASVRGTVRFVDLKPGQCKWIDGPTVRFHAHESLACAAPVASGTTHPFCPAHCERAYYTRPEIKSTFDPERRAGEAA